MCVCDPAVKQMIGEGIYFNLQFGLSSKEQKRIEVFRNSAQLSVPITTDVLNRYAVDHFAQLFKPATRTSHTRWIPAVKLK